VYYEGDGNGVEFSRDVVEGVGNLGGGKAVIAKSGAVRGPLPASGLARRESQLAGGLGAGLSRDASGEGGHQ
jgi:hypothetical protein